IEAPEAYAPTEDEADRIRAALRDVIAKWPRTIAAEQQTLHKLKEVSGAKSDNLFVFWNVARTEIRMVQERRNFDDGSKAYLPWTFYSDGKWRRMEPDTGVLPFWKPALGSQRNKIMIHEGAKAARYIDWLVNDAISQEAKEARKKHPWADELQFY